MDKKLTFVFGLCSLIALIVTLIVTIVDVIIINGNPGVNAIATIISLAAINVTLAIICTRMAKRNYDLIHEDSIQKSKLHLIENKLKHIENKLKDNEHSYTDVADILHSIQDQLRDRIYELYSACLANSPPITPEKLNQYSRTNHQFYLFAIDNIKSMFDLLTGDRCSVCIKILDQSDPSSNITVKTFMRDSGSYRERKSSDKFICEYPYYENTAFKLILSNTPDRYYVSNNLISETTYINANSSWNKFYNATLVCPIRLEVIDEEERENSEYSVLGFICIDNFKGGFNNKKSIHLLASVADSLYNHFSLYDIFKRSANGKI